MNKELKSLGDYGLVMHWNSSYELPMLFSVISSYAVQRHCPWSSSWWALQLAELRKQSKPHSFHICSMLMVNLPQRNANAGTLGHFLKWGESTTGFWSYLVSLLVWLPTIPLEFIFYILSYFFLFFLREHCCCPEGSGGWCKIEKCAWKNSKNSFRTRSPLLLDHRYPVYSLLCCSLHIRSQTKSSCSVEGHEKKIKIKTALGLPRVWSN